jgi:hypothetical protein
MANQNLKGLAWGHRRATGPLEPLTAAFRREHPDVSIEWTVRPLSEFEHQPIATIADRFDLMIIDHPFCGDIAASGACLPLEEIISELNSDADHLYVGPSLASYRFAGHVWAAPVDAATPHAAFRPDLLAKAGEPLPANWEEAVQLGRRLRGAGLWIATPVVSPHAFATVASLMANLGFPIATDPEQLFAFDRNAMAAALDALDEILAYSPPETLDWNAISLSEAMVARDDIVFTPSIYGYATYAEALLRRFQRAQCWEEPGSLCLGRPSTKRRRSRSRGSVSPRQHRSASSRNTMGSRPSSAHGRPPGTTNVSANSSRACESRSRRRGFDRGDVTTSASRPRRANWWRATAGVRGTKPPRLRRFLKRRKRCSVPTKKARRSLGAHPESP